MPKTLSSDPCGVWQRECYDIWLSGFACVSGRKSEACESFSKPEFVVVDHWPIGMDERLGRPLWAEAEWQVPGRDREELPFRQCVAGGR